MSTREIDEGESFALFLSTPDLLPRESQEGSVHIFLAFRGMVGEIGYRLLDCCFHDLSRECLVSEHRRCDSLCVQPVPLNSSPHCRHHLRSAIRVLHNPAAVKWRRGGHD